MVGTVDAGGATPRTPEILNSLMSMTNPFEILKNGPRMASSPQSDSNSSSSSPPSVQHTCSQLIKEGLKHTIQSKRRNHSEPGLQEKAKEEESTNTDIPIGETSCDGLTPEDEERRRRRRERNKIAATKCRLKKREKTVNLVQESELLETQNLDLKTQIQKLENQRRKLVDMLSIHGPTCTKSSFESNLSFQEHYPRCDRYVYSEPHSYRKSLHSCESVSYTRNSTMESNYQRNTEDTRYCRSSTSTYSGYDDGIVNDTSALMNYCRVSEEGPEGFMHSDTTVYTNLNVRSSPNFVNSRDSPTRICTRPTSISLNTSGSEYESNTELVDSPSFPPSNYHPYEEDSRSYSDGYSRGSCIS